MRHRLVLGVTMVLALAARAESQSSYRSPDSAFTIRLPGVPDAEPREGGAIVYRVADGDVTYVIRSFRTPAAFAADPSGERLYDQFQREGVAALRGTLQSQRAVTSGAKAHAGREFVIHAETKGTGKPYEMITRAFRVGGDTFILTATGPRDDRARRRMLAVLGSFVLLK